MATNNVLKMIGAAGLVISLTACGGKTGHDHEHGVKAVEAPAATEAAAATDSQHASDPEFKKQLTAVFDGYVTLKDAFVSSDAAKVKTEATATLGALEKVDMALVTGAAHHDWMTYLGGMQTSLQQIGASTDIETQRAAFSNLSNELYKAIKAFGLSGETAYYDYCPMAFNNKGGYWLAKEDKIQNPYFGDKMLTCGSVEEKLQ